MEASFWLERWEKGETAFHGSEANPLLVKHLQALGLAEGARVFVPLCGKSLDMVWLAARGLRVTGAELSELAVTQFFEEQGIEPEVSAAGGLKKFSAENVEIFCGDIFGLSSGMIGPVDAVYDRAALVALPETMRSRYTAHLRNLTGNAPQFLIVYEYDQSKQEGPPFSISAAEVKRHYGSSHEVALLESFEVPGGLKGLCSARENAWLLNRK